MERVPASACSEVLVLGGRGYLGRAFLSVFPGASSPEVDITDATALARLLDEECPRVVINCAGKTGRPNIDWCESHKEQTLRSNLTGALVVLQACQQRRIYLVHLSSGCVYQGNKGGFGFDENDPPNYLGSFYSRTKNWAEQAIREFPVLILRLRLPFDSSRSERNLIMRLREYRRVLVEPNSMTYLPDFLQASRQLIARRARGIYNVVNQGDASPFQIMMRYRELVDPAHRFEPLPLRELNEVVRTGRSNCLLSTAKLSAEGLALPPVSEAIDRALCAFAGHPVQPATEWKAIARWGNREKEKGAFLE